MVTRYGRLSDADTMDGIVSMLPLVIGDKDAHAPAGGNPGSCLNWVDEAEHRSRPGRRCLARVARRVRSVGAVSDPPRRDALLVVPGFGYDDEARRVISSTKKAFAAEGIDVVVAEYLRHNGPS